MKKTCKILTEKEYEYIKNSIQNIAVEPFQKKWTRKSLKKRNES